MLRGRVPCFPPSFLPGENQLAYHRTANGICVCPWRRFFWKRPLEVSVAIRGKLGSDALLWFYGAHEPVKTVTSFKTRVPSVSLTLWKVSREHIFTPKTLEQSELGQEEPFSSGEIICCNYENTWAADITARGRKKRKKTSPRQENQCVTVAQLFLPDCDSSTQRNTASELPMSHLVCILEKSKLWCWWKKRYFIHTSKCDERILVLQLVLVIWKIPAWFTWLT